MFARPKAVKLVDGTPLANLLTAPTMAAQKNVPAKNVPAQTKTATTKAPVVAKKQP